MKKALHLLLCVLGSACQGTEPGPGYKLVEQTKPNAEAEFFGAPHIDTVIEVYSRPDEAKFFRQSFKIVLSSLAKPSKKELLFEYDRLATADLSPDGKWIVINDRPSRGVCKPRLYKQQSGLKFTEVKDAEIRTKAIKFFLADHKYPKEIATHVLPEGSCFVESTLWSDDSKSLLLRLSKGQTGEPIWINDWRCVYEIATGKVSTDLEILNRGSIQPGKYLAPAR